MSPEERALFKEFREWKALAKENKFKRKVEYGKDHVVTRMATCLEVKPQSLVNDLEL